MLRAVRLAQEFSFSIDPATFAELSRKTHLLDRISRERVKRELFMILGIRDASRSVRQLDQAGILRRLLPELESFRSVRQTAPHQYCLFDHLMTTVEKIERIASDAYALLGEHGATVRHYLAESIEEGVTRNALLVFTALLHDSGKAGTGAETNGRTTFYGHENRGEQYNRSIAERLGLGRRAQNIVARITKQHMRLLHLSLLDSITERAQIRLLQDIGAVFWEVVVLAVADMMATGTDPTCQNRAAKIAKLGVRLANRRKALVSSEQLQPLLRGTDVLQLLETQPGPHVGAILSELQDAERDGHINTRDEAVRWVQRKKKQS
jgi:poly(A) polymerase